MKRKDMFYWGMFGVFFLGMIAYAFFSLKIGFHDSGEYITVAKELAGMGNVQVFSAHSVIYPGILSVFLRVFPSFVMIRLINVLALVLIGFILFKLLDDKKAFFLWFFSPVVWFLSIEVSPIIFVSLFMVLTYYFFKKWEELNKVYLLVLAGFCLGMTFALWSASIVLIFFFLIFFFWKKNFRDFFIFLIGLCVAILLRMGVDYLVFGFAFNSIVRYFGVNTVILMGLGENHASFPGLIRISYLLFYVVPLSFVLFFTLKFRKYSREILFVGLCGLFFLLRGSIREYMTFAPIWMVLAGKGLDWKKILINCIIGLVMVLILTGNYFTDDHQVVLQKEIGQFNQDFAFEKVIAGPDKALVFASTSWAEKPEWIWWKEYELWKNGGEEYSKYNYEVNPNINQHKILYFEVGLRKKEDRDFTGLYLVDTAKREYEDFKVIKEYEKFSVYESVSNK